MKEVINKNDDNNKKQQKKYRHKKVKTYLLEKDGNASKEIADSTIEEMNDDDSEMWIKNADNPSSNKDDSIASENKLSHRQKYKKVPGPEKRGRKSKYYTHVQPRLAEIEHWARNGFYDFQMYQLLGIGKDAFCKYKKEYSEFAEVLHKGGIADMLVENTAFKLAISGLSPYSTFRWLATRNPERWAEKKDLTINGNMITKQEVTVDLTKYSKEELIMLATSIDETEFSKSKKTQ